MPTTLDHVLILLACIAYPAYAALAAPRTIRALQTGERRRTSEYREVIFTQWGFTMVLTAAWLWLQRAPALMGFQMPAGWRMWVSIALAAAGIAFFWSQHRAVAARADLRAQVRGQLKTLPAVEALIPRGASERRWFTALALTAGTCEEVVYRGFLLWYLGNYVNVWVAATVAIAVFALAHSYQGVSGAIRAGLAGSVMTLVYLATGSLLAPMVLHAATDVGGGLTAALAIESDTSGSTPAEQRAA